MSLAPIATAPRPPARQRCPRCGRAECLCACLAVPGVPVHSAVQLLILQHPAEQRAWKNSARLLHQLVAGSTLRVGPAWPAPPPALPQPGPAPLDLLLYPPTPGDAALPVPPALPALAGRPPASLRLVVLDATWRKSRRMLYDSPWLQQLPRLGLGALPPSRYRLRRARGADQRSTFEAAVLALAALDDDPARWDVAWPVFDDFVQRLAARMPAAGTPDGTGDGSPA